jgi:hypothetical protein
VESAIGSHSSPGASIIPSPQAIVGELVAGSVSTAVGDVGRGDGGVGAEMPPCVDVVFIDGRDDGDIDKGSIGLERERQLSVLLLVQEI